MVGNAMGCWLRSGMVVSLLEPRFAARMRRGADMSSVSSLVNALWMARETRSGSASEGGRKEGFDQKVDFMLCRRLCWRVEEAELVMRDDSSRTTALMRTLESNWEVWVPLWPSITVKKSKSPGADGSNLSRCMIALALASSIGSLDGKNAVACFQMIPPGLCLVVHVAFAVSRASTACMERRGKVRVVISGLPLGP